MKSRFLARFILYICEKSLLDQVDEITEQRIGERVFHRPHGYNPGEDNIVRNYARLLRQRLEDYFQGEGAGERLQVEVPRGGYVPMFYERRIEKGAPIEVPPPALPPPRVEEQPSWTEPRHESVLVEPQVSEPVLQRKPRWPRFVWGICGVVLLAVAAFFLWRYQTRPQSLHDRFWSAFFRPTEDTLLVPADSGLVLYEDLTKRPVTLADYASGEYQKHTISPLGVDPAIVNELGGRRYTSVVDLELVSQISLLPQVVKNRFKVRYAREVTLDDLKQSNVILLGSFDSNPWVTLYQRELNFQFESRLKEGDVVIHNLHPRRGEQSFYETNRTDAVHSTFGVIAMTPNLNGKGHVLLIEGLNMAGTEAAAEYLFSDASNSLLQQIFDRKGEMLPFEVLLETSNIGANAPQPHIVSERIRDRN